MKEKNKKAILYTALISAAVGDILPTPADSLYFHLENKWIKQLNNKEITQQQYWTREALAYYGLNPLWWISVLGAIALTKGKIKNKLIVASSIVGAGAVISVLSNNIKK